MNWKWLFDVCLLESVWWIWVAVCLGVWCFAIVIKAMAMNLQAKLRNFHKELQLPICSKLNLNFSYYKPKSSPKHLPKNLDPIARESHMFFRKTPQKDRESAFNRTSINPFPHSQSTSFSTQRKFYDNSAVDNQQNQEAEYYRTRYGFPLRKKLSGEQGLIKLILKRSSSPTESIKYQQEMKQLRTPLYDPNIQTHPKIIPKLKNRTRFSWTKFQEKTHRDRMQWVEGQESSVLDCMAVKGRT